MLQHYDRGKLRRDLLAGVALSAMLIPTGMAYAQASGLRPIYGLYATVVPLVVYAFVGPSRILVLGPDSAIAPLIAAAIIPLAAGDESRRIALASALGLIVGLICIAGAIARFGFAGELLSLPVRLGYLNGIAVTVAVSQFPGLLGITSDNSGLLPVARDVARDVWSGKADLLTSVVGLTALLCVLLLRRIAPRIPRVLLVVVGALVASVAFDFERRGLAVTGSLPRGLPAPTWPELHKSDLGHLFAGGFGIAMVAFADTSLLSRSFAGRTGEHVDTNRELVALGAANLAAGLCQGFPVSGSVSRTSVAESSDAQTQLTSLVAAAVTLIVLVGAPGVFRLLPTAVFAAIVVAAAAAIFEVRPFVALARSRPGELVPALAAFFAVAVLGAIRGVLVAIGLSLFLFVAKAWRPHTTTLVRVPRLKGYHDRGRHPEGTLPQGLVLYRFDAPLFFANAEVFHEEALRLAAPGSGTRWLVVTAEPITDVDATAAAMLRQLIAELSELGVVFGFAELKGHVREGLERMVPLESVGREHFYRTIGEAVRAYRTATNVDWVDWDDESDPG